MSRKGNNTAGILAGLLAGAAGRCNLRNVIRTGRR